MSVHQILDSRSSHWLFLEGKASTIIPGDQMILGIYFPLGALLLLGVRNPPEHRSLLLFTGWSTVTRMAVMITQAIQAHSVRNDVPPVGGHRCNRRCVYHADTAKERERPWQCLRNQRRELNTRGNTEIGPKIQST